MKRQWATQCITIAKHIDTLRDTSDNTVYIRFTCCMVIGERPRDVTNSDNACGTTRSAANDNIATASSVVVR